MLSFSVFVGEDKTSHDLVSEEEYLGHSLGSKHCLFAKILPTVAQRSYMENIHPSICSSKSSLYKHTQSWKLWERKVIILRLGQGLKHFCPIQYKKRGGESSGMTSLPPSMGLQPLKSSPVACDIPVTTYNRSSSFVLAVLLLFDPAISFPEIFSNKRTGKFEIT